MRVGILTYHFGGNYGGVLQCSALQNAISQLGHQAEVIDFQPNPNMLAPFWRGWQIHRHGFKTVRSRYIQLRNGPKCLALFDEFRSNNLTLSPPIQSLESLKEIASSYDAIVTGSDQVWNFRCSPAYFLALDDAFKGKKIAYATCCTQERQPADRIEEVGRWIKDFDSISVRDSFSKRTVESASGRDARIVCDPTLLMDYSWPDHPSTETEGAILVYRLGPPIEGDLPRLMKLISRRFGTKRIDGIVSPFSTAHPCPEATHVSYTTSPIEWASKIKRCGFLLTDSFHGVLFALKYNKPFLAYHADPGRAPRLMDIRERFGIHDLIVRNTQEAESALENHTRPIISGQPEVEQFIQDSWHFLRGSLQ